MKYTLGFTTQYYTLWEVSEPYKKYTAGATVNGVFTGSFYMVQDFNYRQNLSKNYDAAVAKITAMSAGIFDIDLDLRGTYSFTRGIDGSHGNDMPDYMFTFGQLVGQDIRTTLDVWQLRRAMKEEKGNRRRAYARRRLIELGELVRNTVGSITGDDGRWVTPKQLIYLQNQAAKNEAAGHHFENGKRITVAVRQVGGTSYDTQYGTVFIREYMTEDNKLIKYKGSSPLEIGEDYEKVTGTVEHSEYNGQPETRLKRLKKVQ